MNKTRPKQLSFRVSEEEYQQLQEKISESGKNQQEYILSCVLEKQIVNTDGIKELIPELKRIGASGSGNFMTRMTALLATLFFIISLVLGNINSNKTNKGSEWENLSAPVKTEQTQPAAPAKPTSDIPN